MHRLNIIFFAVTTGFLVASVQSAELPARGPIPFDRYDTNSNGSISEEEFSAIRAERMATKTAVGAPMHMLAFSAFDTNGDNQLSPDELTTGQRQQRQNRRGMRDGSGRGGNAPSFADFDLNADGHIIESEFLKAQSDRISERSQQGYPMRNIANLAIFRDVDSNADGAISPEEFATQRVQHQRQHRQ